ncbi:MAG: S53 family serine peptidase [Candidatus Baltobacteraceae bacterium]
MASSARFFPLLLLLAFASAPALATAATPGDYAATVPQRSDVRDLGRAPAATTVELAVALKYRNENQLTQLVELQAMPGSAAYHHFLSNAQFNASFAPSSAAYGRTIATLVRAGFHIDQTFPNRTIVDVSAPAPTVERYFQTTIDRVAQRGHGLAYSNVRPALMPAALRGDVDMIGGFDDLIVAEPQNVRGKQTIGDALVSPAIIGGPLRGPHGGFGPLAIAQGYDFPVQHGNDGLGRATGNSICADFHDTDLAAFLAYFNVTRTGPATTRVPVDGGAGFNGCSIEATLDVETIVGSAPGTAFYEYTIPTLSGKHIFDDYNKVVSDNLVDVLNSSYGGCEVGGNFAKYTNHLAKQGAAKGITFSASSGDSGSSECGAGNGVSAPASGTYFVAVGGTYLQVDANGNYVSETAWNGSGGGFSVIFPEPAFQKSISGPLTSGRNVPDVALLGSPASGLAVYQNGNWIGSVGGTSLSSPAYCALQTEINEIHSARAGHADVAIYRAFKGQGYSLFHDITSGSNGLYPAGPGYDDVTGIGSPQGEALSGYIK